MCLCVLDTCLYQFFNDRMHWMTIVVWMNDGHSMISFRVMLIYNISEDSNGFVLSILNQTDEKEAVHKWQKTGQRKTIKWNWKCLSNLRYFMLYSANRLTFASIRCHCSLKPLWWWCHFVHISKSNNRSAHSAIEFDEESKPKVNRVNRATQTNDQFFCIQARSIIHPKCA